jgi:hypothetical protein
MPAQILAIIEHHAHLKAGPGLDGAGSKKQTAISSGGEPVKTHVNFLTTSNCQERRSHLGCGIHRSYTCHPVLEYTEDLLPGPNSSTHEEGFSGDQTP